jgi:hypothetical protein
LRNGKRTLEQTERLGNGDVISIVLETAESRDDEDTVDAGAGLVKHLFSIV